MQRPLSAGLILHAFNPPERPLFFSWPAVLRLPAWVRNLSRQPGFCSVGAFSVSLWALWQPLDNRRLLMSEEALRWSQFLYAVPEILSGSDFFLHFISCSLNVSRLRAADSCFYAAWVLDLCSQRWPLFLSHKRSLSYHGLSLLIQGDPLLSWCS